MSRYKNEAKLVITSKIHSAMPCVAMGIPVIFVHEDLNNERFDVLEGILPLCSPNQAKHINWNPESLNIEELKSLIKNNAFSRISKAAQKYGLNA